MRWLLLTGLLALAGCGGSKEMLSGRVTYQDWLYGADGLTSTRAKPVRFALVEVLNERGDTLARAYTDDEGRYRLETDMPLRFSLRVQAVGGGGPGMPVKVMDLGGDIYAVKKIIDRFEPVIDLSLPLEASAPFNIFDVYQAAGRFLSHLIDEKPETLNVFWEPGNLNGTYYCTAFAATKCMRGAGIYIRSERNGDGAVFDDRDEYDDDVLLHEYAHFAQARYSRNDSSGGCHTLEANDQALTLAWSEGWGNFFPGAVKTWMKARGSTALSSSLPPSHYVDTLWGDAGSDAGISFDFADPDRYADGRPERYYYAGSEVAVAKVLWDLFEQQNSLFGLWRILSSPWWRGPGLPTNIELLWDGLRRADLGHGYIESGVLPLFLARGLVYQADDFETDDTAGQAGRLLLNQPQSRTLYRDEGDDVDMLYLQLEASLSYRIITDNLKNGADTRIWLYRDSNLADLIASNDNVSDSFYVNDERCGPRPGTSDALGSLIEFSTAESGRYYLKITSAGQAYDLAGRYGGYDVRIEQAGN